MTLNTSSTKFQANVTCANIEGSDHKLHILRTEKNFWEQHFRKQEKKNKINIYYGYLNKITII